MRRPRNCGSSFQLLANCARYYPRLVIVFGGEFATLTSWLLPGRKFSFALERVVSVLVVACPYALGLAIPLVSLSAAIAARQGFL